jgi:hypothetical protein
MSDPQPTSRDPAPGHRDPRPTTEAEKRQLIELAKRRKKRKRKESLACLRDTI